MLDHNIVQLVIKRLIKAQIPYMIIGGSAVIYYGRIRLTHDIDLNVKLQLEDGQKLTKLFPEREFYLEREAILEAIIRKSQFNLIHSLSGLKIDFWILRDDIYSQLQFSRRKRVTLAGIPAWIISVEDLIINKLNWYKASESEKHFEDALNVFAIQKPNLDLGYLRKWTKKFSSGKLLKKIKEKTKEV